MLGEGFSYMLLTLMEQNQIKTLALPQKVSGRYRLGAVEVEGINGDWLLKPTRHVHFDTTAAPSGTVALKEGMVYPLYQTKTGAKMLLFAQPETLDRRTFKKVLIPSSCTLYIGRLEENEICYRAPYVSGRHARLEAKGGRMVLTDLQSANGTFVNGRRIQTAEVHPGDVIELSGFKMLLGKGFFAYNNPDGLVRLKNTLYPFVSQQVSPRAEESEEESLKADEVFYRSPRFKREVEQAKFTIDAPPAPPSPQTTPMMLVLGPSMTMGLVSLSTGFFTLYNVLGSGGDVVSAMPSLVMSVGMLMGTVLWPVMTKMFERRSARRKEETRRKKYREYLEQMRRAIFGEGERQRQILSENIVTLEDCIDRIRNGRRNLWERTYSHNDFLMLRLGIGTLPIDAEFKFPEERFSLDEDPLQEEMRRLCAGPHEISSVPVSLSLRDTHVIGVIGDRSTVCAYTRGLILQIGALHSYDEVKMVFFYSEKEAAEWDFVKWLPHTWDASENTHYVASSASDAREISAVLEREFSARAQLENEKEPLPWVVVFVLDRELGGQTELVRQILSEKKCRGFSIVALYDELRLLPKECKKVVELHQNDALLYDQGDIYGRQLSFAPDILMNGDCRALAVQLQNTLLYTSSSKKSLPELITFLQMFGVGKVEHLNVLSRWNEHDPTRTLATEVGIDENGGLFTLDLHEKFHGPHGLVAGMTGSGKSEFIMTYILSLAVNYHPNEVAFILIDYKGGGMAKAFEKLPHTVGIITNLDGAAVNRSLVSIQSELKRRQAIFQAVSKQVHVSNIDIYKYQRLYREKVVTEPLQHLFIISDEFAELKTQQPDFMRELVSAARIGRSLGVHLILATQKPSGVVDDQIWSNSRFRVCLKVQEKNDSMDMLKRPDAAALVQTGRFYLQVGYNEIFELGQSAWAGAPYTPSDRVETQKDESVALLDEVGHVIRSAQIAKTRGKDKQLDCIVSHLSQLADEEHIRLRPMWMPPLPKKLVLSDLLSRYRVQNDTSSLCAVIGEADDPQNQRQFLLTLPLSSDGNTVVYGAAGGGKTTFVMTMLYSLLTAHTSKTLHLYLLDYGSEMLRMFEKAPQVGDVLFSSDAEKTKNLFSMLSKELARRKRICAEYGGDAQSYRRFSGKDLPDIVTVIHNYAGFTETYEDLESQVALLSREGSKYGILFVITAVNTNAVRYRTLQNFKRIFVLQMNDPSEYSGVLGSTGGVVPAQCPGRGLFKTDQVYEFQTACIGDDPVMAVRTLCKSLAEQNTAPGAPRVPILPEVVTPSFVDSAVDAQALTYPVGVFKESLAIASVSLTTRPIHYVLSQSGCPSFIKAFVQVASSRERLSVFLFDGDQSAAHAYEHVSYAADADSLNAAVVSLFSELVYRHNHTKEVLEQGGTAPVYEPRLYVVNALNRVFEMLTDDGKDKLHVLMEKCEPQLGVFFVLAEVASGISSFSFRPWFKKQGTCNTAIWVGDGIADQFQLKVRPERTLYESVGDSFGYLVKNGTPSLMKLLTTEQEDSHEE